MSYDVNTHNIISAAFEVHRVLGHGFLENVYKHALARELTLRGIPVCTERELAVSYKGSTVGTYFADIIAYGSIVVELKCVRRIVPVHIAQVKNYLRATGLPTGLILNYTPAVVKVRRAFV